MYTCKTPYPLDLVFSSIIKSSIVIDFSTDNLKAPSTTQNGTTNSVIRGITTPFSFINIDPNYPSVKNITQYQSPKYYPESSIDF